MGSLEHAPPPVFLRNYVVLFDTGTPMARTRTDQLQDWIPKLAQAGLAGDQLASRTLDPDSDPLAQTRLARNDRSTWYYSRSVQRKSCNAQMGRDRTTSHGPRSRRRAFALVRQVHTENSPSPILPDDQMRRVSQFVAEREASHLLFAAGFAPPSSILLIGAPGTGKSMLARWFAHSIGLPLLVQDLANPSISSFSW